MNPNVCIHGGLRRQCETCDLADRLTAAEAALAAATQEIERLKEAYRVLDTVRAQDNQRHLCEQREALAQAGEAEAEIERLKAESVQAMARHYGCGEHVSFSDAWRWLAERVEMTRLAQSELETHKSNADTAMDALADRIAQLRTVRERAEAAERQRDALREALKSLVDAVDDESMLCVVCGDYSEVADIETISQALKVALAALAATEGQ